MKKSLSLILALVMLIGLVPLNVFAENETTILEEEELHTHAYTSTVTAPTCTEQGYTTLVCEVCGDTKLKTQTMDIKDLFVWTTGKMIIATTGECHNYADWQASDYVDISAFDSIQMLTADTIYASTTAGFAFYDADKNYISGVTHTDGVGNEYGTLLHTIEIPENAVYVRTTWYLPAHPGYSSAFGEFSCAATGQYVPATGHSYEQESATAPTCTAQGTTVFTCSVCGDSYTETVDRLEHTYDGGVCTVCGVSVLGSDWIAPDFAQGDYTMVVLPDTQILVQYWPEIYYNQMQWIADNKDTLNIQAVLHMGDMVNNNNDTEWTVCEAGTDILNASGIPWMPMMGNHDNSTWFNRYYDYAAYGENQSWFGGSYEEGKLNHTYWFVSVGQREYMILSLGWAPSWDVLEWAQGIVEENSDKSVILTCHAYMNKDGTLLDSGDAYCVTTWLPGYPNGDDVWNAFKGYSNVVLAMGGHIHSSDIVTYVDQNGAGQDVTSLLVDRQDDDTKNRYAMLAVLTFHADSNTVDVNWYSTRYDALFRTKNQFSISVPHACDHSFTTSVAAPTCTEGGGTKYTCTLCGYAYVEATTAPLGHDYDTVNVEPTCTTPGYTADICSVCGYTEKTLFATDLTDQFAWNEGYVISATYGGMFADKNWVASDYVDISAYTSIEIVTADTVNANTTLGIAFYDASKNYISGVVHTDKQGSEYGILVHNLTIPVNAVYVRTTWYSVNHEKYDGAIVHTFYCKGYSAEIPPVDHSYKNNICTTCGILRVDLTDQFTDWTEGGPVLFRNGYGYGEEGFPDGSNPNLKYSGYISVEGMDTLELTVCARKGHSATGGYAFYTDKGVEYFISEGSSTRNGNGAVAEGTVVHTIAVPDGAKYIRVSYWVDSTSYAVAVPFSCVGYQEGCVHTYENGICTGCGQEKPVTVTTYGNIQYSVDGRIVTVAHSAACVVGYWDETAEQYIAIAATANADGSYSFDAAGKESVVLLVIGDVNGDGQLTMADKTLLDEYLGGKSLTVLQQFAADVNGNGKINSADRILLARALMSQESAAYKPFSW